MGLRQRLREVNVDPALRSEVEAIVSHKPASIRSGRAINPRVAAAAGGLEARSRAPR